MTDPEAVLQAAAVEDAVARMQAFDRANGHWGAGFDDDDWLNLARAALGVEIPGFVNGEWVDR